VDLTIRRAKVLVIVKAYPNPSKTYEETVCTAGLLNGEKWVRIYPVPFRFLEDSRKFPKFGWIELDLERRIEKDFRPESHRPLRGIQEAIKVIDSIPADAGGWRERRRFLLQNVYSSMSELIASAYANPPISIGMLRPKEILEVVVEPDDREWPTESPDNLGPGLFKEEEGGAARGRLPVKKIPFRFAYRFVTEDGKERNLMIEDWEIGALYWNCLQDAAGDERLAAEKVRQKCWWMAKERDLYLILGTTFKWHAQHAPNPFVIIGLFYPPRLDQHWLFE
jgi:hypothetical protein